jgi:hypothetical protein
MAVLYIVDPLDAEHREWLSDVGVSLPRGRKRARNSTPVEIRDVLGALDGFQVEYNASKQKKFWQAFVKGVKRRDRARPPGTRCRASTGALPLAGDEPDGVPNQVVNRLVGQ